MTSRKILIQVILLANIPLIFNACCEPKVIVKTEYIKCKYPTILDLNYTNDTNYSTEPIEYEILEEESKDNA